MILVIDNYDSFVETLARYVREEGRPTTVKRHDAIDAMAIREMAPSAIIISPGPGRPSDAGICMQNVKSFPDIPILGVCLGHQVLIEAYGGSTEFSKEPMHGRASDIYHTANPLFEDVPSPFSAARYHSLIGAPNHENGIMETIAQLNDGTPMAVRHHFYPHYGVQFHPESLLTTYGRHIIRNFLKLSDRGGLG